MKLREQAYRAFVRLLLERRLRPGQFVSQRELAAMLDLPLGAIRESIPRLEAEALLTTIPQRGLQVATIDMRLIRETCQLRAMIELNAVAHFTRHAPDALIARERAALTRIAEAAAHGITPALVTEADAVDLGFHDHSVEFLDNALIAELHRVNAIRMRLIMSAPGGLTPAILPSMIAHHDAVLAAIARRDEAGAVAALAAHLEATRRRALMLDEQDAPMPRAVGGYG